MYEFSFISFEACLPPPSVSSLKSQGVNIPEEVSFLGRGLFLYFVVACRTYAIVLFPKQRVFSFILFQGQELMILEAMKMEHTVPAPFAGKVGMVSHMVGDLVDEGSILITLEVAEDPSK